MNRPSNSKREVHGINLDYGPKLIIGGSVISEKIKEHKRRDTVPDSDCYSCISTFEPTQMATGELPTGKHESGMKKYVQQSQEQCSH
jgi:hypothetical protein